MRSERKKSWVISVMPVDNSAISGKSFVHTGGEIAEFVFRSK